MRYEWTRGSLYYDIRHGLMVPGQAVLRRQYETLGVLIRQYGVQNTDSHIGSY